VSPRRAAPLLVVLIALIAAIAETLTTGAADGGIAATSGGVLPLTALGAPQVGGDGAGEPGDVVGDPGRAGDAPRRMEPVGADPAIPGGAGVAARGLPACSHDDLPAINAGLDQWATTLVDTAYVLPAGYHPTDLVPVAQSGIGGWGLVRKVVIDDLRALADAARANGTPIAVQSAYRSRGRQAEVFDGWVRSSGQAAARRFSAGPGHSEHQLGTALDLRAAVGGAPWTGGFGSTAAGRWLAVHAPQYGFVLSYPKGAEALTCYGAEAWHVRYVGREVAAKVAASGLPLRVWLWEHAVDH
jgi:D-alanyl-D-alanine carboxypeptidase